MRDAVEPFRIQVPDEVLEDLRSRLARTRFPDEVNDANWSYGTDLSYLKELCGYWLEKYDWRRTESELNAFAQYKTDFDGLGVHFLHVRSEDPDALPLIITHGWPGSVLEFTKIIDPLTNPTEHGGEAGDAFHVVCPSLPGYGFSDAAAEPGMHPRRIAEIQAKLMARLGYERYGAQGGDWGAAISTQMGVVDAAHCAGIHLNFAMAGPPKGEENPMEGLSDHERANLADRAQIQSEEMGYFHIQSTKPQTLGVALNDSPAGLAAWIVEKFRTWSDCGGDVESVYTKDELLANVTLYWVTSSIASSTRLYCETVRARGALGEVSEVPTGVALFPRELVRPPRRWVEAHYNLQHWTEMPRGGHFAAMEQPGLLVEDVRKFFRKLR